MIFLTYLDWMIYGGGFSLFLFLALLGRTCFIGLFAKRDSSGDAAGAIEREELCVQRGAANPAARLVLLVIVNS